tara:strand:+ start:574 stop:741 length:168 start_codon:yes stop_codon:yes gene_type:complete
MIEREKINKENINQQVSLKNKYFDHVLGENQYEFDSQILINNSHLPSYLRTKWTR